MACIYSIYVSYIIMILPTGLEKQILFLKGPRTTTGYVCAMSLSLCHLDGICIYTPKV